MDKLAQKIIELLKEELEVTIYEKIHYPDDLAAKIEELIDNDIYIEKLKDYADRYRNLE